jgi:hypothetical protein
MEHQTTRKINFTVEIDDNDLVEHQLIKVINELLGSSLVDYQVLTDTKELYENDATFRKITKLYYDARRERNDYINSKM